MTNDSEDLNFISRSTRFFMHQVSRRGFLRTVGATSLILISPVFGPSRLLSPGRPTSPNACPPDVCPGPAFGICSCEFSACTSGGKKCTCVCPSFCGDCDPTSVMAECSWQWVLNQCFFSCRCLPC